ncbi:hypothetical protein FIU87_14335 [Bacillus sp. THAF10]|uniref:DUF92 domain-containing protein n=1 Tax=Bacillus sp. THAF10 TaxID=2587848 RepID=UPI00126847C1|nr:DUF92 domain-containing protein [Bacillus sp. THAF10]QFT89838.1 hypothetical protein FIU87_14335 [Bacillus sp. THAF10]
MTPLLENSIVLFLGIVCLAIGGFYLKALSSSGAFGTIIIGILIAIGFNGYGLLLIGVFFVSSSFWSKFKKRKKATMEELHGKGSKRDIIQVFANGMVPGLFGVLHYFFPSEYWVFGFVTSIAVANADTWASEIGSLSKRLPVSFFSWRKVERGTSGAVSVLGTFAAIAGSALIAVFSYAFFQSITLSDVLLIVISGVAGCFLDTILGATLQAQYRCEVCGKVIENKSHCNVPSTRTRGLSLMTNDAVNVSAIALTSLAALFFSILI